MKTIAITIGDPKGVGPEVIVKAYRKLEPELRSQIKIYGDRNILAQASMLADFPIPANAIIETSSCNEDHKSLSSPIAAKITKAALDAAIADAMRGSVAGIVTAPINKARMHSILPDFIGHTEYLGAASGISDPIMMFASDESIANDANSLKLMRPLRISLVTTHLPINSVAKAITTEKVLTAIARTHTALIDHFKIDAPKIAVLSLNPHAGERGNIGSEEIAIISPAIAIAMSDGIFCEGPFPVDGLFNDIKGFDHDAVIAMYHDQGMLPVKLLFGSECVNLTLGLPFIRTSPGHGTADEIAWKGIASEQGMIAAIKLAEKISN